MPGYQPGIPGDQTGLIAFLFLLAALLVWGFFCWWSDLRVRWEKIYDVKAGTTRYHQVPPETPRVSFPPRDVF